jgi:hypothetical protein
VWYRNSNKVVVWWPRSLYSKGELGVNQFEPSWVLFLRNISVETRQVSGPASQVSLLEPADGSSYQFCHGILMPISRLVEPTLWVRGTHLLARFDLLVGPLIMWVSGTHMLGQCYIRF